MPYMKGKGVDAPYFANPPLKEDRINLVQIANGDSFEVEADLHVPFTGEPATPGNSVLEFVLAENRFTPPLWKGAWMEGITPDREIPGLVRVKIPGETTRSLRRGVYAFSLKVRGVLDNRTETELEGHVQVEYEPSSDCHNIPYRKDWEKYDEERKNG